MSVLCAFLSEWSQRAKIPSGKIAWHDESNLNIQRVYFSKSSSVHFKMQTPGRQMATWTW